MTNERVEQNLNHLRREVERLRGRLDASERGQRATVSSRVFWLLVGCCVAFAGTGVAQLVTFAPGSPAIATQVNGNFAQLQAWIEEKVGAVGTDDVTVTGNLSIAGVVGNGSGVAIRLFNDADITGADIISGYNDLRLAGSPGGGNDILIAANGNVSMEHSLAVSAGAVITGSDNDGTVAALRINSGSQRMLLDGNEIGSNGALYLNNNSGSVVIMPSISVTGPKRTVTAPDISGWITYGAGYNDSWADCGSDVVTAIRVRRSPVTDQMVVEVRCTP